MTKLLKMRPLAFSPGSKRRSVRGGATTVCAGATKGQKEAMLAAQGVVLDKKEQEVFD